MASPDPAGARPGHGRWTVAAVHRYPVKSMVGQTLPVAQIGVRGVDGDRRWAVVDAHSGVALSAKRHPRLLHCRAVLRAAAGREPPAVDLTLPDGERVGTDEPERSAALLTALLERPVRLAAAGRERVHSEFPDDGEGAGAQIVAGLRGMYADGAPLHLLTTDMLVAAADGDADRRAVARYRPNIVLRADPPPGGDLGAPDADESWWTGRRLRLGAALVEVTAGCARCTMIGMSQPEVAADPTLLSDVVRRRHAVVGLYGRVITPGAVATGDGVSVAGASVVGASVAGASVAGASVAGASVVGASVVGAAAQAHEPSGRPTAPGGAR